MNDDELDKLERDLTYFGPSGVNQVVIDKVKLYDLIKCNRLLNEYLRPKAAENVHILIDNRWTMAPGIVSAEKILELGGHPDYSLCRVFGVDKKKLVPIDQITTLTLCGGEVFVTHPKSSAVGKDTERES